MTAQELDAAIARLAARQFGVISRAQILSLGASSSAISRRVGCGSLVGVAHGIYRTDPSPEAWVQRLWILWLAAGHCAYVSTDAAGAQNRLEGFPRGRLSVTVAHGQHQHLHPDLVRQTRRPWPDRNLVLIDGLPTTDPAATLVDVSGLISVSHLFEATDGALHERRTTLAELSRAFAFADHPARPGRLRLASVLDRLGPGEGLITSKLERIFHETVAALGYEPWIPQMPFPGRELPNAAVDAGDGRALMIVECDSRTWHGRTRARLRDIHRDRAAGRAGYHVVRVLGEELLASPEATVREVEIIRQVRRRQVGASRRAV